ncbi:hypothetical protein [Rhodopirellula bahusiensis]|uniref:hypothetical protein n=2 Tax=Rhodopirellula bahusiensis TaxID=2014065 RepID=UPI003265BC78
MKPTDDSRILLLEQLESRSLLAAGIFNHSDAGIGSQELDRAQIDRAIPALQRTVSSIEANRSRGGSGIQTLSARSQGSGSDRPMRDFTSISRPDQSFQQRGNSAERNPEKRDAGQNGLGRQRPGIDSRRGPLQNDASRNGSLQSSVQTSVDRSPVGDSVQSVESNTVVWVVQFVFTQPRTDNSVSVGSVLNGFSGGGGRTPVGEGTVLVRANSSAAPSEQGVADGSNASKASASDNVTADVGPVQRNQTTVDATDDVSAIAAATTANERTNSTNENSRIDVVDTSSTSVASEVDGGIIDWLPRVSNNDVTLDSSGTDDPWELDERTLEHLREVARAASNGDADDVEAASPHDSREASLLEDHSVDDAMATWFGSPTGLIDGIQFQDALPTVIPTLSPGMVDVALDATVGVHRTVGLMASADAMSGPVALNDVRDAVLAAMAFETDALAQPALDTRPLRLSGLTYPGAALVAGTLALNARRRRSGVLLTSR